MAVKVTQKYTSQEQYLKDLAQTSFLFNQTDYSDFVAQGRGNEYASVIYGTSNKTKPESFDWGSYNVLQGENRFAYVVNEYYVDRNETAVDETTGETYNVYERNKQFLNYQIEQQVKEDVYNSLSTGEKIITSIGGFIGDAAATLWSIGEGVLDAVLFLEEGAFRIYETMGMKWAGDAADTMRSWMAADTTGARNFQNKVNDFISKYTIWDKNSVASTIREISQSVVKMAPLALPGVGTAIYYGSMAGDLASNTIQSNPDVDYGTLFAYTAGSVGLEALVEWGSSKLFGGDTISNLLGFESKGGLSGVITDKLIDKPVAMFFSKMGLDMFTEGLEEGVTEIFSTLLEQATVNPEANLTVSDVLHAALVGALTGGIMAGGSVLGTKSLIIDPSTGNFALDENGNYATWSTLSKEQRAEFSKQSKIGKMKTIAYKEALSNYVEGVDQVSEITKLKNKYNQSVDELKTNHAKEYEKAEQKDIEFNQQQGMAALKLSKIIETIGVPAFNKAVQTLQQANDNAIERIDRYLNPRIAETTKLKDAQERFAKNNPGINVAFKETLSVDEKKIQTAIKQAYGTDVYFGDFGSANGLNPGTFIRNENEIFIDSNNVKNMSYQQLLDKVIKQELVGMITQGDIISQNDFRNLIKTILPEGIDVKEITPELKKLLAEKILFEEISISKVFDTNKQLFGKTSKWLNFLKKKNRMAKKDDVNKAEFNQLLKIRQKYVGAVTKAIGNEVDLLQAKIIMELSDDEVEYIKNTYIPDATNEHIILMKKNFTKDASDKRNVERMLIQNRLGDKRLKLDYSQIYNPEYYKDDFVKIVVDSYPGLLFRDALWYYVSDNTGYSISQAEGMLYKQVNLVAETNPEFSTAYASALKNKDKQTLENFNTIDKIINPTFLKSFDKTGVAKVKIEYVDVMKPAGRTIVNPDGSILIQINTDANHLNDGLLYSIYHEISHALGYVQGFPFGTSPKITEKTLRQQKPALVRNLGVMMFDGDYVEAVSYDALIKELSYEIYRQSQGERYASGERESFVQDADGFDVIENKIIGKGRYSKIAGIPLVMDFTGYTYTMAESTPSDDIAGARFIKETNITDLVKEGFSEMFINEYAEGTLNKATLWNHINTNTVGTKDATNKLITWLTSGKNKRMKTIDDVDKLLENRIGYVLIYYGYRWNDKKQQFVKSANSYPSTKKMGDIIETLNEQRENQKKYNKSLTEDSVGKKARSLIAQAKGDVVNGVPSYTMYFLQQAVDSDKFNSLKQHLIEMDFNYSEQDISELMKWLSFEKQSSVEKTETRDVRSDGEDEYSLSDQVQAKKFEEEQLDELLSSNEEADKAVESAIYGDSDSLDELKTKLREINQKYYSNSTNFDYSHVLLADAEKSFLLEKFGKEGYIELLRLTKHSATQKIENLFATGSLQDVLRAIKEGFAGKENTFDNNIKEWLTHRKHPERKEMIKKRFGEAGYKQILKALPKRKSDYKKDVKYYKDKIEKKTDMSDIERRLYSVDTTNFKPSDFEEYLSYLKNPETLTNPDEYFTNKTVIEQTTVKKPKTTPQTSKTTTETKQITTTIVELTSSLSTEIVDALENIKQRESEVQLVDKTANKEHIRLSKDLIAEHSDIFFKITKENFDVIRNDLIRMNTDTSRRALILVDLYGFLYLADSTDFRNKMHDLWAQELSIGMTRGGIQSALVRENTAQALKQEIESQGREIEVTNDDVVEILGDETYSDPKYELIKSDLRIQTIKQKLEGVANEDIEVEIISPDDVVDKDAEINRLKELNKQLNQDVLDLTVENETDRKILLNMLQEEIELKTAMEEGDYVAVLDILLNKMGLEEASEAFRKMMRVFWNKSQRKDIIIGKYTLDAKGEVKPFSGLRRFTGNLLTKFKKFRMWAMLSSPVTYVKNWIGNVGMKGLDNASRSIERFINEKTKLGNMYGETDVKYVSGKQDKQLAQKIKNVYGEYISSLIRGTEARYDVTGQKYQEIQRLQNEQNIKNGNIIQKGIALALKYEDRGLNTGLFGDEPMLANSISEKVADLIASNSEYLLKGIKNEYDVLKKQKSQLEKTLKDAQEQLKKTPSKDVKLSQVLQKRIASTIKKLDRITAMETALKTKNTTDILSALSEGEIVNLFKNAKDRAFTQYFKNNNKFNEFIGKLGEKSPIAAELVSWIMPFPKVAANILSMAYRYSPLNVFSTLKEWSKVHQQQEIIKLQQEILKNGNVYGENIVEQIKTYRNELESLSKIQKPSEDVKNRIKYISDILNAYDITQKYKRDPEAVARLARRISETSVGTTMWIAGAIMAVLGLIDIDDDDYMGVSLKIGDFKVSLSDLAPTLTTFSVGSSMVWAWKNDKSAVLQALDVLYDNTLLGNIENIFHYSSAESFVSNLSINYLTQYIPSIFKLITKGIDKTQKDKSGNYFTKLIRTFGSYLPGLSYLVPTKMNPYTGEPVMRSGTGTWWFNILYAISPLNIRYAPKTELEKLAETLETETTGLSGTFTINGVDYKITDKSYLASFRAKHIQSEYEEIANNKKHVTVEDENGKRVEKYWKDLNETEKKRVLSSLYTKATNVSKIEYWTSLGKKYIVTNQDDLKYYKSIITNKSNIIYKQSWSKSKFVEG